MFEIASGLKIRASNTYDRNIVDAVMQENRYRLPSRFAPDDVVLDIGAHIGSFSYACVTRGVGKVYAFEPDEENCQIFSANLESFIGRVRLSQTAVWRSDVDTQLLKYTGYTVGDLGVNCGGGNVVFEDGRQIKVRCESLDSILSNIRRVRLLKLDCESSEWPILFTCRLLETIDEIVGEFHEIGSKRNNAQIPASAVVRGFTSYSVDDLVAFLERHDFVVDTVGSPDSHIGIFFARRRQPIQAE